MITASSERNYLAEFSLLLEQDDEGLLVAVELVLVYQTEVRVHSVPPAVCLQVAPDFHHVVC